MEYRESNRQKKISSLFKKELASVFQEFIKQENKGNLILPDCSSWRDDNFLRSLIEC